MGNFAVACDEKTINKGNDLLNRLAMPGEKKGDVLNRVFDIVSGQIDEDVMKKEGVDIEGLKAALSVIETMFKSAVSSREVIKREYEQKIKEIKTQMENKRNELEKQMSVTKKAEEEAVAHMESARKMILNAKEMQDNAREKYQSAQSLVEKIEKNNILLEKEVERLNKELVDYESIKAAEKEAQRKVSDLSIALEKKTQAMDNALKELKIQAELSQEKAVMEKERQLNEKIRQLEKKNAMMDAQLTQFALQGLAK